MTFRYIDAVTFTVSPQHSEFRERIRIVFIVYREYGISNTLQYGRPC